MWHGRFVVVVAVALGYQGRLVVVFVGYHGLVVVVVGGLVDVACNIDSLEQKFLFELQMLP